MSSIYGILHYNQKPVTADDLAIMESPLAHWAADARGMWFNDSIGLGHLMLYNTPESLNEKLPLHQSDSRLTITADARIDNRDELLHKLDISKTNALLIPDSTLILKAYQKYGEDCVKHLIGDFAFAIWDENEQKLFCARDHMGVKPFFYYQDAHRFAFATEKKGLLNLPGIDKTINKQFLYNSLIRTAEQRLDTTIYQYIKRLPPAHTLTVSSQKKELKPRQYWDMDAETELHFPNQQDYYDGLLEHFKTAVKCRIRSAYPIGVELSGGMDSSGITGVASHFLQQEGKNVITISNTIAKHVTDEKILEDSERTWIDAVVKFNNIKSENAIYTIAEPPAYPFEEHDILLKINDGLENWHQMWQMPIRQAAQKAGVRTLLSGFPGDEMVTYRGKYYFLDYLDKKQYAKYFLAKKKFPGFYKIEPFIPYSVRYKMHHLKNTLGLYNKHVKKALKAYNIPPEYFKAAGDANWLTPLKEHQYDSYRHYQKHRFLRNHLPARMESETRYGLYFGFEPRHTMADIRLTQYYLSMPNYLKYEGTLNRTAYRKALKDFLPHEVLERDNKFGGMSPYREPITDEAVMKQKQEAYKKAKDALTENVKNHPLFKQPFKQGGFDVTLLRWLEQNPDALK
jgi:asparagine synthase (glutamine-hydrolysing)